MIININQLAQQELTPNKMLRLEGDKLEIVEKTTWRRFKAFMGSDRYNLQKIMTEISKYEINVDGSVLLNRNFYKNILEIIFILENFNNKNNGLFFQGIDVELFKKRIITDIDLASFSTIKDEKIVKKKSIEIIQSIFSSKYYVAKPKLLKIVKSKFSNLLKIGHKQKQAFITTKQKEYQPRQWEIYQMFFQTVQTRLHSLEGEKILKESVASFTGETVIQVKQQALNIFQNLCQAAKIDSNQYTVKELLKYLAQDSILLNKQGQLAFNYVHLVAILADIDSRLTIPTKEGPRPLKEILVQLIEHFADRGTSTSPKAAEKLYTKLNAIYFDLKNHQYS